MALEAESGTMQTQNSGQIQAHGIRDGQGDPGRDLPRPTCRRGGNDPEKAGGEELARREEDLVRSDGQRGERTMACDVLSG